MLIRYVIDLVLLVVYNDRHANNLIPFYIFHSTEAKAEVCYLLQPTNNDNILNVWKFVSVYAEFLICDLYNAHLHLSIPFYTAMYQRLRDVNQTRTDWRIRVHITRMWPSFSNNQHFTRFNLILLDDEVMFFLLVFIHSIPSV